MCFVKFTALCLGMFRWVFICPHSFSVFTDSDNVPFALIIIVFYLLLGYKLTVYELFIAHADL